MLSQLQSPGFAADPSTPDCAQRVSLEVPTLLTARYQSSARSPEDRFTASIRNLFSGMGQSRAPVPPMMLLNELRTLAPQFAEMDSTGRGFAQQGTIFRKRAYLYSHLRCRRSLDTDHIGSAQHSWLSQQLRLSHRRLHVGRAHKDVRSTQCTMTEIADRTSLQCPEAPDEPVSTSKERVLKLECNINISTNYMVTGILEVRSRNTFKADD